MASAQQHGRLCFIDTARAIAILMMLQGHFIAVSLCEAARDPSNPYYLAHARLRSYTAPLFLTVSGLVFVYFLCSSELPLRDNPRVGRGCRRGLMLIGLGYLLHLNLPLLHQDPSRGFALLITVHVLNVIGVGLLVLVAGFAFHRATRAPLSPLLAALGLATMVVTPLVRARDYGQVPHLLQNYLITDHGSAFTLFPFLGYVCFGGACGALIHGFATRGPAIFGATIPLIAPVLVAAGLLLHLRATALVFDVLHGCPPELDCGFLAPTHVWLSRVGAIVAVLGLLMSAEPLLRRWVPRLLLRTGQQTLFVFIVHAVLLYGIITGFGADRILRRALSPAQAAAGAVLFVALHVALVHARDRLRTRARDRGLRARGGLTAVARPGAAME